MVFRFYISETCTCNSVQFSAMVQIKIDNWVKCLFKLLKISVLTEGTDMMEHPTASKRLLQKQLIDRLIEPFLFY